MNRTLILAAIMISLIVFWLIGFVNTLHDDVYVRHGFNEKALVLDKSYDEELLLSSTLTLKEKKRLWNNSILKVEMLQLFPHFIEMKAFVEEHVVDDGLFKKTLLSNIEDVEFEYIGASLSVEDAIVALSSF